MLVAPWLSKPHSHACCSILAWMNRSIVLIHAQALTVEPTDSALETVVIRSHASKPSIVVLFVHKMVLAVPFASVKSRWLQGNQPCDYFYGPPKEPRSLRGGVGRRSALFVAHFGISPRAPLSKLSGSISSRVKPHVRQICSAVVRTEGASFFLQEMEFDVIIIGAGVIGLTVANRILAETTFSVAVVDAKRPCAGATGAGQGYVWMNHRVPASKTWELAHRGKLLWEELVANLVESGSNPRSTIGWQTTGSLLVTTLREEAHALESHVQETRAAGVDAKFLTAFDVGEVEPSLEVGHQGSAAFVPGDSQIDAALAVALVCKRNSVYQAKGRYLELFESPVEQLYRSPTDGSIEMVQTSTHKLHCKEAVVVAAGAWSSKILAHAAKEWNLPLIPAIKPRKGHLLVLEGLPLLKLNYGLMEFEYMSNYTKMRSSPQGDVLVPSAEIDLAAVPDDNIQVAMTASMDNRGRLLLGSSREFSGFDTGHNAKAIEGILNQASKFLPALREISVQDALEKATIRTGLRPYVLGGVPLIGPVPGVEGLMLATGHEGSGLCMALSTAEILVATLLGKQAPFDIDAHLPAGRLCHATADA